MPKKKSLDLIMVKEIPEDNAIEIYVRGDMLPISIFNEILQVMLAHQEKQIHFKVYTPKMMLLIREALPTGYYNKVELITDADSVQPRFDAVS